MAERTIVWVQADLIDEATGNVATPSKKRSGGPPVGDFEANRKAFRWVRCLLPGGSLADSKLNVEIIGEDDGEYKKGEKLTIKTKQGAVLFGNDFAEPPPDLITLTHLHEPSVVYSLQKRYESDIIYTNTGPILLALNPFKSLPGLYDDDMMTQYWRVGEGVETGVHLDPHVFANADKAFRQMLTGIIQRLGDPEAAADQSILVSGESGAGKTVTTKHIMKYLASLSSRKAEHERRRRAPSPGRGERVIAIRQSSVRRMSRQLSWKAGAQIEEKSKQWKWAMLRLLQLACSPDVCTQSLSRTLFWNLLVTRAQSEMTTHPVLGSSSNSSSSSPGLSSER
jgi:hypothetical protein